MIFDVNATLGWATLFLTLVNLAGLVKAYFSSGEKQIKKEQDDFATEASERLDKAEHSLRQYDRDILTLKGELKHLPSKDMVVELKLAMAALGGTVGTLSETLASVSRTVHRIDDYLRDDAKK